jgi:hypothetical protein
MQETPNKNRDKSGCHPLPRPIALSLPTVGISLVILFRNYKYVLMISEEQNTHYQPCETKVFWGEIAPSQQAPFDNEEDDNAFLDLLEGYITGGFKAGDCVVVLVTELHRAKLYERLNHHRVRLNEMLVNRQFIAVDAEDTLDKFMVNGHPDEKLFMDAINKLIVKAHQSGRPVRAFGEMVAHLWAQGCTDATMELEGLWSKFCEKESLTLLRAYPGSGMVQSATRPMMYVYGTHRTMVTPMSYLPGDTSQTDIPYQNTFLKKAV